MAKYLYSDQKEIKQIAGKTAETLMSAVADAKKEHENIRTAHKYQLAGMAAISILEKIFETLVELDHKEVYDSLVQVMNCLTDFLELYKEKH